MSIQNLFSGGHAFHPYEHELKTKYLLLNSMFFIMSMLLLVLGTLRYYTNYPIQSSINFLAALLTILGIYLLRKLPKGNYKVLAYSLFIVFSSLLIYSYYNNPLMFNIDAWFMVLGLPMFLIFGFYITISLSILFMLTMSVINYYFIQSDLQNLVYGFVPIFVSIWFIHIYEARLQHYVNLLKRSNQTLEETVKKRTKVLEDQRNILNHQAHYDALTNLPNRVMFQKEIQEVMNHARKTKNNFALLFIDLDQFKKINDSYGHDTGDQVIRIAATRIKKAIQKNDRLARLGGDEFTILVEGYTYTKDLEYYAQKIIDTIQEPIIIGNTTMFISCSIGISLYPDDTTSYQDMIKYADTAMYKAKELKRGQYTFYSSDMTEIAFEKVLLETSMRFALEEEDFLLYYQPQINGETNELIGMEALVRWKHETMGLISPSKFIPMAEDTGLIIALDQWVMKTGMRQMKAWYDMGLNPKRLSLNLSMKQLQEKNLITVIEETLQETGCKAEWIEFEITESHIMHNVTEVIAILQQIKDLGMSISIDDFGTGYSSLAYLKRLPIDKLKIDRSFIIDIPDNKEDAAITNAIIGIANSLGLNVIAEGVETERQNTYLLQCGCKYIQGHFYHKPMPSQQLESLLHSYVD